jgi:membrane-bound metal-dependent hydrolase YbcI (DUF457 family)
MPFTLTHVAAILPVAAAAPRAFPFSALVIGSMIPDLPLFMTLPVSYATTHSIAGLFVACLPMGLAAFLTFQGVLKRPLFALMPDGIRSRCATFATFRVDPRFKFLARASLAIVIGATTHVFWDSFTHRGRWGTRLVPWLNDEALAIWGHGVPGYKALQYGSTLVVLPCMAALLVRWLARQPPAPLDGLPTLPKLARVAVWLTMFMIPALVALFVWVSDDRTPYMKLGQSVTASGLALGIAMVTYSLCYHAAFGLGERRKPQQPSPCE